MEDIWKFDVVIERRTPFDWVVSVFDGRHRISLGRGSQLSYAMEDAFKKVNESVKIQESEQSGCDCFSMGRHNCPVHGDGRGGG